MNSFEHPEIGHRYRPEPATPRADWAVTVTVPTASATRSRNSLFKVKIAIGVLERGMRFALKGIAQRPNG
jgi:hypothetical protein